MRFCLLLLLILFVQLPAATPRNVIVNSFQNKVLVGQTYHNITSVGPKKCLELCLQDCRCLSFHICAPTQECQLSSSNRMLNSAAYEDSEGCNYIDFQFEKYSVEECSKDQCTTDINCCMTSTPCHFGGTCIPYSTTQQRFTCKCRAGFKGAFCEQQIKSCRDYKNGNRLPGYYIVSDRNGNPYSVFCHFNANGKMSWTLIQSYSLENKNTFDIPFTADKPRNEGNLTWSDYRLSFGRMAYIHEHSVKWRFTCNYVTNVDYNDDYARALIEDVSLFTNMSGCVSLQSITIRGIKYFQAKAYLVQTNELALHFLGAKSSQCGYDFPGYVTCNVDISETENNFGNYKCINPDHGCSASPSSTTQMWLGGQ